MAKKSVFGNPFSVLILLDLSPNTDNRLVLVILIVLIIVIPQRVLDA